MSNNPWEQKALIGTSEKMANSEGFRLGVDLNFNNKICLFTKGANEHGFSNDTVIEAFPDWKDVIYFLSGWKKRGIAIAIASTKQKKVK